MIPANLVSDFGEELASLRVKWDWQAALKGVAVVALASGAGFLLYKLNGVQWEWTGLFRPSTRVRCPSASSLGNSLPNFIIGAREERVSALVCEHDAHCRPGQSPSSRGFVLALLTFSGSKMLCLPSLVVINLCRMA